MNDVRKTIGWAEYTWNPITGCRNGCDYCYARRIYTRFGKSFEPQFHPERLGEPLKLKKPSWIFCGSVTDFWSEGVKPEWIGETLAAMEAAPQHHYCILTKKPEAIPIPIGLDWPAGLFVGVSVTGAKDLRRVTTLAERLDGTDAHPFVSFEPLLESVGDKTGIYPIPLSSNIGHMQWIIAGGKTRPQPFYPEEELLHPLTASALIMDIPMWVKPSCFERLYQCYKQERPKPRR